MKIIKYTFIAILLLLSSKALAMDIGLEQSNLVSSSAVLQKGMTSEAIKQIQNILKSDTGIYPQGLATGYYGSATESAVKKLQARYGLPQTGIVDPATMQVIFPSNVQIKVLTPNGGETWDKSSSKIIKWQTIITPSASAGQQGANCGTGNDFCSTPPATAFRMEPFYNNISIDLVRDSLPYFRYHIGTANISQAQYEFKIPTAIQNASDYRIKISSGFNVPCLTEKDVVCPMYYPQYSYSDVSDNVFSIIGSNTNENELKIKIINMINQLQQQVNNLQSQINELRQLVNIL